MGFLKEKQKDLYLKISRGKIKSTIESIKSILQIGSEKFKILLLIEGHFHTLENESKQGIIDAQSQYLERNKISLRLIKLIDDLQKEDIFKFTFVDPRDDQTYEVIQMKDGKFWMAENLNFQTIEGSWCYENNNDLGDKYGRLYTWDAAIKACPSGWHLPSKDDWANLASYYGGADYREPGTIYSGITDYETLGKDAYNALIKGGFSDFSALLGGQRDFEFNFGGLNEYGCYWSSTEYWNRSPKPPIADGGWLYVFIDNKLSLGCDIKWVGCSCRCVKD